MVTDNDVGPPDGVLQVQEPVHRCEV